jgi:histidinol dehydrogenase
VLPTAGTARFSSALSVDHFVRRSSVIYYAPQALAGDAADIALLAGTEGLDAHARAVALRLEALGGEAGDQRCSRISSSRRTPKPVPPAGQ